MNLQATSPAGLDEPASVARAYLEHLLSARRREALDLVHAAIQDGLGVDTVYVDVLQPVLYEIGRLWQRNEVDVATEHYVTAATQLLMAQIFPYALEQNRIARSVVAGCLGSELHEVGMRMVCDLFEFAGWDTYFLGAITPGDSLLNTVRRRQPDVVCLSATMAFGVPQIRDLITDLRNVMGKLTPKIMVGGLPFIINPDLAVMVGADATAADARGAVEEAKRLFPDERFYAPTE